MADADRHLLGVLPRHPSTDLSGASLDDAIAGAGHQVGHPTGAADPVGGLGAKPEALLVELQAVGRRVEVRSGQSILAGVAEDLASDGALLVRTDEGVVQRVIAGELADA